MDSEGQTNSLMNYENMDMVLNFFNLDQFYSNEFWIPTPIYMMDDLILVSENPEKFQKYSVDFIGFDSSVLILLIVSMVATCLITSHDGSGNLIDKLKFFSRQMWDAFFLFFIEPIPLVSKRIFRRFVLGSWLLAVTVISIWVSCIFKSDAYEVGYLKINDLDDWLKHSTTPLVIVRNSDAFRYFNAWRDNLREEVKISNAAIELMSLIECGWPDFMKERVETGNRHFLIQRKYLEVILHVGFTELEQRVSIYLSEKPLTNFKHVFALRKELRDHPFKESLALMINAIFEMKSFDFFLRSATEVTESFKWKEPEKIISPVNLKRAIVAFKMYAYGIVASVITLIGEHLVHYVAASIYASSELKIWA